MSRATHTIGYDKNESREFVRRIITKVFKQKANEKQVREVAARFHASLPKVSADKKSS